MDRFKLNNLFHHGKKGQMINEKNQNGLILLIKKTYYLISMRINSISHEQFTSLKLIDLINHGGINYGI